MFRTPKKTSALMCVLLRLLFCSLCSGCCVVGLRLVADGVRSGRRRHLLAARVLFWGNGDPPATSFDVMPLRHSRARIIQAARYQEDQLI